MLGLLLLAGTALLLYLGLALARPGRTLRAAFGATTLLLALLGLSLATGWPFPVRGDLVAAAMLIACVAAWATAALAQAARPRVAARGRLVYPVLVAALLALLLLAVGPILLGAPVLPSLPVAALLLVAVLAAVSLLPRRP